mmetsp:Transcript_12935/g.32812  ORF Transcript_12935/g.32812 Transcript_12935/m.32812 type:complete len:223 (-) Transcript_12935:224-892(-)
MRCVASAYLASCESRKSAEMRRASMLLASCESTRCAVSMACSQSPAIMRTFAFSASAGRNHPYVTMTWLRFSSALSYCSSVSNCFTFPINASSSRLPLFASHALGSSSAAPPDASSIQHFKIEPCVEPGFIARSLCTYSLASSSRSVCHANIAAISRPRSPTRACSFASAVSSREISSLSTIFESWCACSSATRIAKSSSPSRRIESRSRMDSLIEPSRIAP